MTAMREETRRDAVWQFLTYSFILLGSILTLVPLYWIFVASTLSESEFLSSTSPRLLPGDEFFANLQSLQARENVQFLGHIGQMTQYVDLGPVYFAYDFWHLWNPGASPTASSSPWCTPCCRCCCVRWPGSPSRSTSSGSRSRCSTPSWRRSSSPSSCWSSRCSC
ncbi:hypothetical protein [Halogeometricum sp. CBA1124]|uniref:hypothetical protein n=1 Tax=Halogeometricum sp. CBA1124 TaxID=2668071 RepID=UPI001E4BC416|nr:hypothetical protein [Halogeometricum sp. CBA1124]